MQLKQSMSEVFAVRLHQTMRAFEARFYADIYLIQQDWSSDYLDQEAFESLKETLHPSEQNGIMSGKTTLGLHYSVQSWHNNANDDHWLY